MRRGQDSQRWEMKWSGAESRATFHSLARARGCNTFSPSPACESTLPATCPRRSHFYQVGFFFFLYHVFARKETRKIEISWVSWEAHVGVALPGAPIGSTPPEIAALTWGPSCHGWLLPIQGKHLGQTMCEKRKAKVVTLPRDPTAARPFALSLGGAQFFTSNATRDDQLTSLTPIYVLCNVNNSCIQQCSINAIHLAMSKLPEYRRGTLIHCR